MRRPGINLSKMAIVGFLTVLIWVWSDLALDERHELQNLRITVAKSSDPSLWVSFGGRDSVMIATVTLRGPGGKISEIRRKLHNQEISFDCYLSASEQGYNDAGLYTLNVADFLARTDAIRREALSVESTEPTTIEVRVEKLVEQTLAVECFDQDGRVMQAEIEPPQVKAYVPEGEVLTARVRLTRREADQARENPIEKTPVVEFAEGQVRQALESVRIRLAAVQERLKPYSITTATVGYCFSENLAGKYEVQLDNPADLATVLIKATAEAKQAYERQPFQLLLEILDQDVKAEPAPREVIYTFPADYVRTGDIELAQPRAQARFKLIPVSPPKTD